jgi:hypothetical protein
MNRFLTVLPMTDLCRHLHIMPHFSGVGTRNDVASITLGLEGGWGVGGGATQTPQKKKKGVVYIIKTREKK